MTPQDHWHPCGPGQVCLCVRCEPPPFEPPPTRARIYRLGPGVWAIILPNLATTTASSWRSAMDYVLRRGWL